MPATDFGPVGLEQLREAAATQKVAERVATAVHDVREPLPLADASVDAVFAHMLLCMTLSTKEIHTLVAEVRRVLRPGGAFVHTVRHTGDAHYRAGTGHGDDDPCRERASKRTNPVPRAPSTLSPLQPGGAGRYVRDVSIAS